MDLPSLRERERDYGLSNLGVQKVNTHVLNGKAYRKNKNASKFNTARHTNKPSYLVSGGGDYCIVMDV